MRKWRWTSILTKICMLMELYFTMQVGVSKLTYIFLSWMNTSLRDVDMVYVIVLVYLTGAVMFLLPPVPGLPVYVFAGILLGEKGRQSENIGFWGGCVVATVLGLFTKLCACVGQYMIGYTMGFSSKVQQLISVDKVPTRAIEKVLKMRGLNIGKVSVLVGAPDWPTSVTCGIVGVNIPQMLVGTLPVIVLLGPCIVAGGCMGRVSPGEDSPWNLAANASIMSAVFVNAFSMGYAIYTIGRVIEKDGEELAKPRPEHAAVAELTRREAHAVAIYESVTRWSALSPLYKGMLATSSFLMIVTNAVFTLMAEACFRPFAVSSRIDDPYENDGLNGSALNIVIHPTGSIGLCLFLLGIILHIAFLKGKARHANKVMEKHKAARQLDETAVADAEPLANT